MLVLRIGQKVTLTLPYSGPCRRLRVCGQRRVVWVQADGARILLTGRDNYSAVVPWTAVGLRTLYGEPYLDEH
jgi:hypothetical protein